jgi:hypothetical protein
MAENKKIESADAVEKAAVDQVFAVSRHADGSPAQTPGFKSVDPEATAAISEAQLREQAASAVDYLHRQGEVDDEGSSEPDAEIKALKSAQEAAADAAAKKVEKF